MRYNQRRTWKSVFAATTIVLAASAFGQIANAGDHGKGNGNHHPVCPVPEPSWIIMAMAGGLPVGGAALWRFRRRGPAETSADRQA